jgi:serine/threonine protein kinase/tetratricopeptide (TPR) repeat protein
MIQSREIIAADLESFVEAFECANAENRAARLEEFLPPRGHQQYGEIVAELLRVDLELGWRRGEPTPLERYRERFADVLSDPAYLAGLAFEDYRQRCDAGQTMSPADYTRRFEIDTSDWPLPNVSQEGDVFDERSPSDDSDFPLIGQSFAGFELVELLGRGAFGRVFLARQRGLAYRPVALKITRDTSVEPDRLARLQHTNIVPIYSVHQEDRFEAICMPFLGGSTLADVIDSVQRQGRVPRSGQELLTTVIAGKDATIGQNGEALAHIGELTADQQAAAIALAPSSRAQLERASYVDAVAWIVSKIAAGVAHAHERGILHRDLKPANVLLADDGRPMLLDFNLSDRLAPRSGRAAAVGGTLPYMAPEHLEALETGVGVDGRSDVYSLGVIMFELLTGRLPFETPQSASPAAIVAQIAARRRGTPSVRQFNRETPHSIAAVVAKCLAPQPDERYQTAEALRIDLERHLDNLPLRQVTDRSPRERLQKWVRRHPRLSSATSIGTLCALVFVCGAVAWIIRDRRFAETRAIVLYNEFIPELARARLPLSVPTSDPELIEAGIAATRTQLERYEVSSTDATRWHEQPAYALLGPAEQEKLDREVAKALQLLGAAKGKRAGQPTPRTQIADDKELRAIELLRHGKAVVALPILVRWRDASPGDLSALNLLANAYMLMHNPVEAEECLSTAVAQEPRFAFSYFHRGLVRLDQRKYAGAADDFSMHITLGGPSVPALVNRAIARNGAKDFSGSLADINAAIAAGTKQVRIYFMRAEVNRELGNDVAAEEDMATGLSLVPQDALSFIARGVARLQTDANGALKDFRQALAVDPSSRAAKQNIVHLLGDRLGHEAEALAVLNSILDSDPRDARALASRAVLKARQGDRERAIKDAVAACHLDSDPTITLQAACAFALSAEKFPGDRVRALHLLARSIAAKPELATVADKDPDLKSLRSSEEFRRIQEAADVILKGGSAEPSAPTPTK